MKNIKFIGTSHISKQSVKEIKKAFEEFKPELVAVELDRQRLHGLMTNEKPSLNPMIIKEIGVLGYIFAVIGSFMQKKLGNIVGTKPGVEMLEGIKQAQKHNTLIFLVDQDIRITLRNLSKIKFSEKLKLVWELMKSPFSKEKIKIDLNKVPAEELVKTLITDFKKKFPGMYKALVSDRNKIMAERIYKISQDHPDNKLLVIIGEGHRKDLIALIEKKYKA